MATYLVVAGMPDGWAKMAFDAVGPHEFDRLVFTLFDALAVGCRPAPRPPYGWFTIAQRRDRVVNHDPYGDGHTTLEDTGDTDLGRDGRLVRMSGRATCGYTTDAADLDDAVAATTARLRAARDADPLLADATLCAGVATEADGWDHASRAYVAACSALVRGAGPINVSSDTIPPDPQTIARRQTERPR